MASHLSCPDARTSFSTAAIAPGEFLTALMALTNVMAQSGNQSMFFAGCSIGWSYMADSFLPLSILDCGIRWCHRRVLFPSRS